MEPRPPISRTHPELAAQAVGWDPSSVSAGSSSKKLRWRCPEGHEWEATPNDRKGGAGCPYCSGRIPVSGVNDLRTTHPELAAQAVGWDPSTVSAGSSNRKLRWRCEIGHEWDAIVKSRAIQGSGCPYCANKKLLSGFNDLATVNPELARQIVGVDPTTVHPGSHQRFTWRCDQGHEFEQVIAYRTQGQGCPYCARVKVLPGFSDLLTTNPELAAQLVDGDPTTISAGSNKQVAWRCDLGHEWRATPNSRTNNEGGPTGCPYCARVRVLPGFNDLATTHPELAAQAANWDPTQFLKGTKVRKEWVCRLGHHYFTPINERTTADIGCPYCNGSKVLVGFNDLATTNPDLADEADGWDPATVTAGSHRKVRWKCPLGHRWKAPVGNRARLGSGCPTCTKYGFDPNADGYLYFLRHDLWGLFQIGISNVPEKRLAVHQASDWEVIELRGPMPGDIAYGWEQDILGALRRRGVRLSPEHVAGKFSGYTESWIQEDYPVSALAELMALVRDDDESSTKPKEQS